MTLNLLKMKKIIKVLTSFIILTNASAHEPFLDFIFGKTYSNNFSGVFNNLGSSSQEGVFHLNSGESFEIELGIRDESGLSVGLQSAYKKMAIDEVSINGLSLDSKLVSLDLWEANKKLDIDGNFFTMPIMVFVGKDLPITDKLSLDLGVAGGYTAIITRPEKDFALFFEEDDSHVWEIQTKLGLNYMISEQIKTGISYRHSWLTDPDFNQSKGEGLSIHFLGVSLELSF